MYSIFFLIAVINRLVVILKPAVTRLPMRRPKGL